MTPMIETLEGRTLLSGGLHSTGYTYEPAPSPTDDRAPRGAITVRNFEARLRGASEVPARATAAGGSASFRLTEDGKKLSFTLRVRDLDNPVAAHLHLGSATENGPIVVLLFSGPAASGTETGVLSSGRITRRDLTGPLAGLSVKRLLREIKARNIYVNVHTDDGAGASDTGPGDFASGEIRGQVRKA